MQNSAICDSSQTRSFNTLSVADINNYHANSCTIDQKVHTLLNTHKNSIVSINCQNLVHNIELLRLAIKSLKIKLICVSEIWQASADYSKLENFKIPIFKNRKSGLGGGVGVYIHNDVTVTSSDPPVNKIKCKVIEHVGVEVFLDHTKTQIISIYRKPNSSIPATIQDLKKILECLNSTGSRYIICGDTNIDLIKSSGIKDQYIDLIQTYQSYQLNNEPTRVTNSSCTNIDHLISNMNSLKTFTADLNVADHYGLFGVWKESKAKKEPKKPNQSTESNYLDVEKSAEKINLIDWNSWKESSKSKNINEMYSSFKDIVEENLIFKKRKKSSKSTPHQPWMNFTLLAERQKVLKLKNKFSKTKSQVDQDNYKIANLQYKSNLKSTKATYFESKLKEAGNDGRLLWKVINQGLQRKAKTTELPDKLVHNNQEFTNDQAIANLFNAFFKETPFNMTNNITSNCTYQNFLSKTPSVGEKMKLEPTNSFKIYQLIQKLKPKPSSGYDGITSQLLKKVSHNLCGPICIIINKSFLDGIFPSDLKISKLQPILKTAPKQDPKNWRPINQLPIFSKICEKIALEQINDHFTSQNVISNMQFGFRPLHSTIHPILLTRHFIERARNQNLFTIVISIDLKSAFDVIQSSTILIDKYEHYGLDQNATKWLKSFFTGRSQIISWNNIKTERTPLHNISVVQGSSIGPGAFNTYVNDIQSASNFITIQFADDGQFLLSHKNLNTLIANANKELEKILDYFESNKLLVSKAKSNYMLIPPKPRQKIPEVVVKLGDEIIPRVSETKFLGILIDDQLKFKSQFEKVRSKLRSTIGALCMVKKTFGYKAKILLYNGLFKSYLTYGFIAWADCLSKQQHKELELLQKKAIRLVFGAHFNTHTSELFRLSGVIPFNEMYRFESLIFLKKLQTGKQPSIFNEIIGNFETNKSLRSSQQNKLKIPKDFKKGNVFYSILKSWNDSELDVKNCENELKLKQVFKDKQKEILLNKMCMQKRCFMCTRDKNRSFVSYMKT